MSIVINPDTCQRDLESIAALKVQQWDRKIVCKIAEKIVKVFRYSFSASSDKSMIVNSAIKDCFKDQALVRKCMNAFREERKWAELTRLSELHFTTIDDAETLLGAWRAIHLNS